MSEARRASWSLADFLTWEAEQGERHEFVGGRAVMMAGGTQAHALIAANIVALLRSLLRGSGYRPAGSGLRVPIPSTGNARYPDATIDCGRFDPAAHDASEPRVVFEVLSKSTGWYDQTEKLRDYAAVPAIRQYVCVSQSERRVGVWLRDEEGRLAAQPDLTGESDRLAVVDLAEPLALADIYEGLDWAGETAPG